MKLFWLLTSLLTLGCVFDATAQRICKVDNLDKADLVVYVSNYSQDADLLVYRVDSWAQARNNNGRWYFDQNPLSADFKIRMTKDPKTADLVICYVDYLTESGWRNISKSRLLRK